MPPKARGGGKKGPPPPSYTEADVSEFRAVTGCDSDAAARRSLAATRGDVSEAIIRYLEVHASVPKPPRGDDTAAGETVARRQANLHESKRQRVDGKDVHDAAERTPAFEFDFSAQVGTPRPDQDGWVTSLTQELEAQAETKDATDGWARAIMSLEGADEGADTFEDAQFPPEASSIDGKRVDVDAESVPRCRCGVRARIKSVHKDGPNHGRAFYACGNEPTNRWERAWMKAKEEADRNPGGGQSVKCEFFKWADDAPCSDASRAMKWRRFEPPRFKLSKGVEAGVPTFAPSDVRQGAVGDCWLLSALAVVAERKDLVARVVGPAASHPAAMRRGAFLVRLFLSGRWRGVAVDPHLPVSGKSTKVLRGANKVGSRSNDEFALAYSRAADNQLWVPLVEKAYAKCHGSYHAISGGWIAEGLLDLTGCPTETIKLDETHFDSEAAWTKLVSYAAAKFPMGCATQGDPSHANVGIVGNHAYSVMEVRELHGAAVGRQTKLTSFVAKDEVIELDASDRTGGPLRLLRIRNPWGRKEWSGEWGARSEVWTNKLGAELGHTRVDDGTFWMSWHDFLCRFTVVDVCKAHEGWHAISAPAISAISTESDPAFEVEVAPERGATAASSWGYVMSLQPNKRGLGSERYWYADVGVAVYRKSHGTSGPAWTPVTGRLGARERVEQVELMFEAGVTYLVMFFSVTGFTNGPPPILRLYSARPMRIRPLSTSLPNLAPALHSMLLPSSSSSIPSVQGGTRRGGSGVGDVKRRLLPMCGGALVVCRCRGGLYVLGVSASPPGSPPLRVWLRVRAVGRSASGRGISALHQHPPPPPPPRAGVDPGVGPIPGASMHEVPAGRCRVLALALATGASDSCSHALDIAAEQAGACVCCAKRGGTKGGRAGSERRAKTQEKTREKTRENGDEEEVEITGEVDAKTRKEPPCLFEELGLPAPPPGTSDEAIAKMLADALALAAARDIDEDDDEGESSDGEVEIVGEVESAACRRRRESRERELAKPATAPPARLAQVFAHLPAPEALVREVSAMRDSMCVGGKRS